MVLRAGRPVEVSVTTGELGHGGEREASDERSESSESGQSGSVMAGSLNGGKDGDEDGEADGETRKRRKKKGIEKQKVEFEFDNRSKQMSQFGLVW